MKIEQKIWTEENSWESIQESDISNSAQLVLGFGSRKVLSDESLLDQVKSNYPNAQVVFGSTAGEIVDVEVHDDSLIISAVEFEKSNVDVTSVDISEGSSSFDVGKDLAEKLLKDDLKHIFVVSDGLNVNGSDLINGMREALPNKISITGGLAGDGAAFEQTLVGLNNATPNVVVGIGLYGNDLTIGYGSVGGWDPFGPERNVTKSEANVLYELDGKPALDLYKTYLGDKASELPSSALLFPLNLKGDLNDAESSVVRTVLAVDDDSNSMTFAGDIPQGSIVQLMKANFDRLVDGASNAAENSIKSVENPELALLVSCVGRKLVLGQRIEDEVEAIREVIGDSPSVTGFYSYGELAPGQAGKNCQLHNQTMTITLFSENS